MNRFPIERAGGRDCFKVGNFFVAFSGYYGWQAWFNNSKGDVLSRRLTFRGTVRAARDFTAAGIGRAA